MEVHVTGTRPGMFEAVSFLLHYPSDRYRERLDQCVSILTEQEPEAALRIGRFGARTEGLPVEALQELFTQTFDLDPVCSLEVGWQLYGEEYARGNFLVAMRSLLREHGIEESGELPDHLVHLLPLLDRLEDPDRSEVIGQYIRPALAKMLKPFQGKKNPYEEVLRAMDMLLARQPQPSEVVHG